jgi:hypothetical protein
LKKSIAGYNLCLLQKKLPTWDNLNLWHMLNVKRHQTSTFLAEFKPGPAPQILLPANLAKRSFTTNCTSSVGSLPNHPFHMGKTPSEPM